MMVREPSSLIYSERNQSSGECKGQKSKEDEKAVMICKIREKMVNHNGVNKNKGHRTSLRSKKNKRKGLHSVEFKRVGSTNNRFVAVFSGKDG